MTGRHSPSFWPARKPGGTSPAVTAPTTGLTKIGASDLDRVSSAHPDHPTCPEATSGVGIAQISPTGHHVLMAAVLVVFFLFVLIYRFALRGKGVVSGKLATILAILFGLWILMAVYNLALGDSIVAFLASGVATLFHGIGAFLTAFIP